MEDENPNIEAFDVDDVNIEELRNYDREDEQDN